MQNHPLPRLFVHGLLTAILAASVAHATAAPGSPPQDGLTIESPTRPVVDLTEVENLSEAVANEFLDFSDALRRREFEKASGWVAEDFAGHAVAGLAIKTEEALPLGARSITSDCESAPTVDREEFLAGFAEILGPWQRVEQVLFKVKGAEFQAAARMWGKIRFKITALGTGEDGGPRAVTMWANAKVAKLGGRWGLQRFQLESKTVLARPAPLFREVATSAGVAQTGIRFGKPGNQNFAWNGLAAGDVDGDGHFDVFVPKSPKSQLYMSQAEGTPFRDEAEARGLTGQDGGTGAVFFDADGDGDQDLAVGGVAWRTPAGGVAGTPLHLYMNDGSGKFTEEGLARGFGDPQHAYSLVVFDTENDGQLDVYVTNYGRVEAEPNDSWVDARNGTPDALYVNQGQGRFKEMAAERGLRDTRWSYAAAAADFDEDGDQDIYVANDYGTNSLWRNTGSGSFEDVAAELGVDDLGNGMGCAWGDLNADGLLDLYVVNMSSTAGRRILGRLGSKDERWAALSKMAAGNSIFIAERDAQGQVTFERLPSQMGGIGASWAWSTALIDIDLDGLLDIYCCNGYVTGDTAADT